MGLTPSRVGARAGGFLSYFTRHRTAANLLLVVLIVLGVSAFPNMRSQFFPDVIIESISVSVGWDGAGAEDVDRAIVQLLEPALLGVEGVESSSSTSSEGSARVSLDFEPGWDMARAADDVQQVVDAVTGLPEEADDPVVRRAVWRQTFCRGRHTRHHSWCRCPSDRGRSAVGCVDPQRHIDAGYRGRHCRGSRDRPGGRRGGRKCTGAHRG
jgi:hypothetical protein